MNVNLEGTLVSTLGIEIEKADQKEVRAKMPVDERTRQPFGLLHGGASVALAETVASIGAFFHIDPEKEAAVGLEINANHIKGKKDGFVTAIAKPVHQGRTTMVWEIRIVDEEEDLICISRCTMAIVHRKGRN
ncbi:hotdog fold thioesterase [Bacillus kexueae]|uniref:hotdog fold thioesterase n=1 Tax=Aeribacillus kexueae TaxID=2078952 RepID=UPI001FAFD866